MIKIEPAKKMRKLNSNKNKILSLEARMDKLAQMNRYIKYICNHIMKEIKSTTINSNNQSMYCEIDSYYEGTDFRGHLFTIIVNDVKKNFTKAGYKVHLIIDRDKAHFLTRWDK